MGGLEVTSTTGHRSGVLPHPHPVFLASCTIACVCSAPRCGCLGFHLRSPTGLAPKSLLFWEAGLPASVRNFSLAAGRPPPPGCWLRDLAGVCGMNANEKAPGAGVHLGQAVGKFLVSSPFPSPLCLSQQGLFFPLCRLPHPIPLLSGVHSSSGTCCTSPGCPCRECSRADPLQLWARGGYVSAAPFQRMP